MAASHFLAFLRSNYEQALALPLCIVFGFIAASQGQWWSVFIFAFSFLYAGILLRAWRKSRVEAAPSRSALVNRRDIQRMLGDPDVLARARELPVVEGVHAGIIPHDQASTSFVKLDTESLVLLADWGAGLDPETPRQMNFLSITEALSWCSSQGVAWLVGTRAEERVLHALFPEDGKPIR